MESIKKEAHLMKVNWNGGNKYQVAGLFGDQCVVDVTTNTCSCRKWELTGIPYKHVVAAYWNMALNDRPTPPLEAWARHNSAKLAVGQDSSGVSSGSGVGVVIGLFDADCAGGASVGVGSQGPHPHTRCDKRRVIMLNFEGWKLDGYQADGRSCVVLKMVLVGQVIIMPPLRRLGASRTRGSRRAAMERMIADRVAQAIEDQKRTILRESREEASKSRKCAEQEGEYRGRCSVLFMERAIRGEGVGTKVRRRRGARSRETGKMAKGVRREHTVILWLDP
ncbi:hypothetical protein Tco_0749094 [Tanacetum coccineum]|uniref:SWIM-type domain-containing protein n=1 Tax=Tanacetum coccineum TaxID=301880 RepID=A0ABQ4Z0X4_9ASTR